VRRKFVPNFEDGDNLCDFQLTGHNSSFKRYAVALIISEMVTGESEKLKETGLC